MQSSTDRKSSGIPVNIYSKTGKFNRGMLYYRKEGPYLESDSDQIIVSEEEIQFSFLAESKFIESTMIKPVNRFVLKPELVLELGYSPHSISGFEMYPPSTTGWLPHVVDNGLNSIYTIQTVVDSEKKLLTIVDKISMEYYHASLIHPYEVSILKMNRDWDIHRKITYSDVSETSVFGLLKKKSISWPRLSKLVEGVTISNLSLKETMEDTLSQLVPKSFPSDIRRQIMAFLAWLDIAKLPQEDPIEYLLKHSSVGVFRTLAIGHIQCLLDKIEPPHYVQLLDAADRNHLQVSQRPQSEAIEQDAWSTLMMKLHELFPNWMDHVIKYARSLQTEGHIITELPVSRQAAEKSQRAWRDRFALAYHMLFMRGHIHKELIGLLPAMYIGAAHRWPHKHLEWSARLGYSPENPQYIQTMVMPASALERVSRIIPTVRLIDWEMSSVNLSLYNDKQQNWKVKKSLIVKSLEGKRSLRQLRGEFGRLKGKSRISLSKEQIRILDCISWALYISLLESERYANYLGLSNSTIKRELEYLLEKGVFELQYFLIPEKLRSLCIIANGPSGNVCSMARAFLKYTPSSQIKLTNKGSSCVAISRIPEDKIYSFVTHLNEIAGESGITLRTYPISAYAGYRNNLYSRLFNEDGSWDDDVSGLLSQVRLPISDVEI